MTGARHEHWPACEICAGSGEEEPGFKCQNCNGLKRDPKACEKCEEVGVAHSDDGDFLCAECLAEWAHGEGYDSFELVGSG
jgi:RecJ-like exonuclease